MSRKTRRSPIGFDPLAWMKGGSGDADGAGRAEAAEEALKKNAPSPLTGKGQDGSAPHQVLESAHPHPNPPPSRGREYSTAPAPVAESRPEAKERTDDSTVIALADLCTFAEAHKLYEELKQALAGPRRVVLDATDVRGMDTAVLQLLDAFMREATVRKVSVVWRHPEGALMRDARTLGLAEKLQVSV